MSAERTSPWPAVIHTLCTVASVRGAYLAARGPELLDEALGPARIPVVVACVVVAALSVAGLAATLRRLRHRTSDAGWSARKYRLLAISIVVTAAVVVAFFQPVHPKRVQVAAGLVLGAFAATASLGTGLARRLPRRAVEAVDLGLTNVAILVVLLEVGLRVVGALHPSPLFDLVGADADDIVRRKRMPPNVMHLGFPTNASGFYDEEFTPPTRGERQVVAIGDSFSTGVVPHGFHYTTVCERSLPGVRVHNVGIPGIGPSEYLLLLRNEVLPLRPDLVVVSIFVGNDVVIFQDLPLLDRLLDRRRVRVVEIPRRILRVARERGRGGAATGLAEGRAAAEMRDGVEGAAGDATPAVSREDASRRFPWVLDPTLEEPTFSEKGFLAIERERVLAACVPDDGRYGRFFGVLEKIHAAAGATPLLFMLIPDEFQVEDDLWAQVTEGQPATLDRDQPQRLIGAWLAARGLRCLDLLPEMRAAAASPDGRRRLYHLRNTHWNAAGNGVAGEALAKAIRALTPPR